MKIVPQEFNLTTYLNTEFQCDCGRLHSTPLRELEISAGAIKKIPELIAKYNHKHVFIICDCNTHTAAGERLIQILQQAGIEHHMHIIDDMNLVPDEAALGEVLVNHQKQDDLIIAVGTGTINDLCKYLSCQLGLPYFIVATAPSMDGFASDGAALITKNLKVTYAAQTAEVIIGDLDILCQAPKEMIAAGLGDILGKYTCLLDWKLAHLINGEYYCPTIVEMVDLAISRAVSSCDKIEQRDPQAIQTIMEALVLTGIAMSFVANSRPASGSEHHISHFWEMRFLQENRKPVLHGCKVGIGAIASTYMYHYLSNGKVDFDKARQAAISFSYSDWEQAVRHTYAKAADGVIALEANTHKNSIDKRLKRIDTMETKWPKIVAIIEQDLPQTRELERNLCKAGAPINPSQVGVDYQTVVESVVMAKEVRDRYTLLQMLWDLGVEKEMAERVACYFSRQQEYLEKSTACITYR